MNKSGAQKPTSERLRLAVPAFGFQNQHAIQDAQSASTFLQALEEVAAKTTTGAVGRATGEACADGIGSP